MTYSYWDGFLTSSCGRISAFCFDDHDSKIEVGTFGSGLSLIEVLQESLGLGRSVQVRATGFWGVFRAGPGLWSLLIMLSCG